MGGNLCLLRISEPAEVAAFIQAAQQISARSWQGEKLDTSKSERLSYCAKQGWLRSYMLTGNGQPVAHFIGRQSDGVLYADDTAFDSRIAELSPGKILWLKVIEDLHAGGDFRWLDFGSGDIGYKQFWANESYPESTVLLIKPSFRNALAFWPMMAAGWPVAAARKLAAKFGRRAGFDRRLHQLAKSFRRKH
jgi:CelD/BcsL family acetyltransferase involved in cellulose biosynthesis